MPDLRMNLSDTRNLTAKKKVDTKYVLRKLLHYMKPYMWFIVLVFLLNIISSALTLVGPELCGIAIDCIDPVNGTDFDSITFYCIILAVIYVISGIALYLSSVGMAYVSRKMGKRMRADTFSQLLSLPVSYFDSRQTGDIISVLSYDIDSIVTSLSNDVIMVLRSVVEIAGSLAMMLYIAIPMIIASPAVSSPLLIIFVVTIPLTVFTTQFIVRKVQPLFRKRSAKLGELNGFVEEMVTGQKTTKAYNCEEKLIDDFEKKNVDAVDAYAKAEYYGTMTGPFNTFISNISLTLVSVIGGLILFLSPAAATLGQISSFMLYSRKFSGPVNEVSNVMGEFQSAFAAAERVFRVLDETPERDIADGTEVLTDVQGDVEISHVRFGYDPDKVILKDFSLDVKKGQTIAIVGHTGAGKTTVINLLMRFYDPQSGTICIDGKDISTVTRDSLRRAFTMVLQDTWLFAGTVYENIAYGNGDVTREDVERVCKAAKIHTFITRLPQGYDTVLTENAVNISKGQKQLLTIARAMLLDSPMLILDEATSNVDTRTEQTIQQAMRLLMQGRTCFVIAHRLSTIKNADKILVMQDGDVVEQGTHESLMASGGVYRDLYTSQFESY
ncbi:MAG: ABC transporter ATP-binding protein/permease [Clostridia bacterium]|nr:ABC transporter ATP-binding protein/permease [Clostridia bacterium]